MRNEIDHPPMKYNKLSHYILSLLLSSTLLGGCNKHPMAAMSEEENSFQESVGGITILESEPLESMDSARVPGTIAVAQEASAHGLSASQEIVGVPGPLAVTELQASIRGNRARKKVISQQNAALLAGAAALGGYVTNSLFTWQSASKQQEKQAQEHQKLVTRIRTIEEALSLPAMIDVDTTPISQASDATCVSGTRLFVPPSVSVSQALPVGLCTLLAGRYLAKKIQYYRNVLTTAEKEARAARDQEIVQTRNALAAVARANREKDAAVARANEAREELAASNQEIIAQTRNVLAAVVRANTERDAAVTRANEEVTNANTARDAAVARANEEVVVANTARDAAVVRANEEVVRATTEKEEALARENEAVTNANTARDAAVARANEEVVVANTARDAAVVRANEEVVRATTEKEEALARENEAVTNANTARDAAVAKANELREELAAREQEIAQTSNALAVALRPRIFGEAEWKQYFGDVGSAPPLPSDMATILDGPCPFWPDQLVKDTHLLVLIPATVGGVPFTLNRLGELIQHPSNGGHRTEYNFYDQRTKAQIGAESPPRSYWVLMTRDVLPDSRSKTYKAQKEMVARYASRVGLPYELPHALEAATAILMHHAREGERFFGNDPLTYTRCQEVLDGFPVIVGGFSSGGLVVNYYSHVRDSHGASCLRKF
jgi:hypothetical protein